MKILFNTTAGDFAPNQCGEIELFFTLCPPEDPSERNRVRTLLSKALSEWFDDEEVNVYFEGECPACKLTDSKHISGCPLDPNFDEELMAQPVPADWCTPDDEHQPVEPYTPFGMDNYGSLE
jgi:hypothetical protein